jgi:hypothetical protein
MQAQRWLDRVGEVWSKEVIAALVSCKSRYNTSQSVL